MERKNEKGLAPAVLVYSHSITPRLEYIIHFLADYYGLPFRLVPDEGKYLEAEANCRINYSYHPLVEGEIWIHPHPLLFETAAHPVKTECFGHEGYTAFFKAEGNWGFDLFAAVFYLLSRYEECLPHKKDSYGRYAHENSLAFREGFLHLPLVNTWLESFRKELAVRNPAFNNRKQQFELLPTYDIDMAWSFRNKGWKRNAAGLFSQFIKLKWKSFASRIRVLRGKEVDPFDSFEWMNNLHSDTGLNPIYFFLVAAKLELHDRNIPRDNVAFRELVRSLSSRYSIGLHPSWASGDDKKLLKEEKNWLEQLIQTKLDRSRQHFIRFNLPEGYRNLLEAGIKEDHSMGYGSINGFRASITTPFFWYDLREEKETDLKIYPFCFMDANAFYEEKKAPAEALAEMRAYRERIRAVDGLMITIWHNSFLGTDGMFDGWREVYREFVIESCHENSREWGMGNGQ